MIIRPPSRRFAIAVDVFGIQNFNASKAPDNLNSVEGISAGRSMLSRALCAMTENGSVTPIFRFNGYDRSICSSDVHNDAFHF